MAIATEHLTEMQPLQCPSDLRRPYLPSSAATLQSPPHCCWEAIPTTFPYDAKSPRTRLSSITICRSARSSTICPLTATCFSLASITPLLILHDPLQSTPISVDQVDDVVAIALGTTPAGLTRLSTRQMAEASGLSHNSVHQIWRSFGIKPHRSGSEGVPGTPECRLPHRARGAPTRSVDLFPATRLRVGLWRWARRVELGRLRRQMHGNEDLLGDRVGLDDGDGTQKGAALGALNVDGKGPSTGAAKPRGAGGGRVGPRALGGGACRRSASGGGGPPAWRATGPARPGSRPVRR